MTHRIKNWNKFQHFKDRRPPWIKLYRDLLDDPDWHDLDGDDAKALVMIWLIASEEGGAIPDTRKLAFRLRISTTKAEQLLNKLSQWLVQDDIEPISDRYHDDAPETETETEEETERVLKKIWPNDFRERFWLAYPRRVGKKAAMRRLEGVRAANEIEFDALLRAIGKIDAREEKFIPHPATWLNEGRYLDSEPIATKQTGPPKPPAEGLPSDAELRAIYERDAAESERVLGPSESVHPPGQLGRDRARECGAQSLGAVFSASGLDAMGPEDAGDRQFADDYPADTMARVVR